MSLGSSSSSVSQGERLLLSPIRQCDREMTSTQHCFPANTDFTGDTSGRKCVQGSGQNSMFPLSLYLGTIRSQKYSEALTCTLRAVRSL